MHFSHNASAALAVLAALGLVAARPVQAQTSYTFTTLDDPLAGTYAVNGGTLSGTEAWGINDAGEIVGFYDDSAGTHGFTETPGGGFSTLPDPGALGGTGALGINNAGQIVGGYGDGTSSYGFVYTPGVGFQKISDPSVVSADGGYTTGYGINNSGQVVGIYQANSTAKIQSFLDTPSTNGTSFFAGLSDPNATGDTIAKGINDSGQVVGHYSVGGFSYGFLLAPGGGFTDIIDPASPKHTTASSINDLGQVAGYYLSNTGSHGFVETPGVGGAPPTFAALDDPAAVSGFTVQSINNDGQVVGYYRDANSVYHGFLATPAAVPEASSVVSFGFLLLMGAGGLWFADRRRAKSAS
ncbi:MAG: hypothetical protein ACRYFS_15650 [Janthinobacterium lividum]